MAHYHQNNTNTSDYSQNLYGKDGEYGRVFKGASHTQESFNMPMVFKPYQTIPTLEQPMESNFYVNSENQVNYMINSNQINQIPQVTNNETTILDPIDTNNQGLRNEKLKRKLTVSQPPNAVPSKMKPVALPIVRPLNIRQHSFPVTKSAATRAVQNDKVDNQAQMLHSFSASHTPDSFNDFFYFPETPVDYPTTSFNQNDEVHLMNNKESQSDYNTVNHNSNVKNGKFPMTIPNKPVDNFPIKNFKVSSSTEPNRKNEKDSSKKPSFYLPLDNIGNSRSLNSELQNYSQVQSDNLRILEPDLGIDQHEFNTFNTIITPSMKPPGTNQNEYFEDYTGIKRSGIHNSPEGVHADGFSENEVESYLYNDTGNSINSGHTSIYDGNKVKQEIHTDLTGFNLDLSTDISSAQEFYAPIQFKPIETNILNNQASESPKEVSGSDNDKEAMMSYLNVPDVDDNENDKNSDTNSTGSNTKEKTKKKRIPKGAVCSICDKYISRDLTRHKRIHNEVGRFQCVYPKNMCGHKTQHFNRPYDYKKHLLHMHFKFDDPKGRTANNLTDKLPLPGICQACGTRYIAGEWLDNHVLTNDSSQKCTYIDNIPSDI